ncbi:MAG: TauD/TfdA family dioxygenase [Formosimonas sp.]
MHIQPKIVTSPAFNFALPQAAVMSEPFIDAAAHFAPHLPTEIQTAVAEFRQHSHASGALLLRGLPVGDLPATPPTPTTPTTKDDTSEFTLLTIAKLLGEPVGYQPELGGRLIQNLVPTQAQQDKQVSTSSKVILMFHTEAAFHPHRPAYLILLCLKGDANAFTTLASIREVLPKLPASVRRVLFEPRFRTAVDESYLNGRANTLGPVCPVLTGDADAPTMVFDEDLMVGIDDEAQAALGQLARAVEAHHTSVCLQQGDMLIIDNAVAVHGRSSYTPRFDGTDRWLQRTFVVDNLHDSATERDGRVIMTTFGV